METSTFLWLIAGFILGWSVEYVIDRQFWRRAYRSLESELNAVRHRVHRTESETGTLRLQTQSAEAALTDRDKDFNKLKTLARLLTVQLKQAKVEREAAVEQAELFRAQLAEYSGNYELLTSPDRLTSINGIRPDLADQLNEAGITTLDRLAELSEEEIHAILGNEGVRQSEPRKWIAEASKRVEGRATA